MRTFDNFRFTAAGEGSPLADVVLRALEQEGDLSITALRAPGFRALAPLMDKAQVAIDTAVVEVGLQRLTFVADLMREGLVYNLPDPLSITQLEWYKTNRKTAAQRVMSPSVRTENKMPTMLPYRTPIYLTLDGFSLDIRTLKMSQRIGTPLDTTLIKSTTRGINEALEDAAINGATTLDGQDLYVAGYTAPGLLNAPDANTHSLTAASWDATPVGDTVISQVLEMIGKLQADKKYGPYNLYLPTTVSTYLQNDLKANSDKSIWARLQEIDGGGRKLQLRTTDMMPSTKVVLVQMTSDVCELIQGQAPTVIPWTSLDGFTIHNLVMAIQIPRFRSDYNGDSGVCIGTIA